MAEQPFDPVALWRDMLGKWEAGVNEAIARSTERPDVASAVHHLIGLPAQLQQAMAAMMSHSLTAMNIPSHADLVTIGERLQAIEKRLDQLAATVESNEEPAGTARTSKPVRRTRKRAKAS